jgi:hypothetical protein
LKNNITKYAITKLNLKIMENLKTFNAFCEGVDVTPEPNKAALINKAKQNIGKEYRIEQAGWQGDHWQSEWGEIEEKGIRRHMGDDDEYGFLDTWNDIDVYVLEEILNNILEK